MGTWTGELDRERAREVLSGDRPFDESMLADEDEAHEPYADETAGAPRVPATV